MHSGILQVNPLQSILFLSPTSFTFTIQNGGVNVKYKNECHDIIIAIAVIISKKDNFHFAWLCSRPLVMERLQIKPKKTLGLSDRKPEHPWKSLSEKIREPINVTQIWHNMLSQATMVEHPISHYCTNFSSLMFSKRKWTVFSNITNNFLLW